MTSRSYAFVLGFSAACCFAMLPGCQDKSATTVAEATDGDHGDAHDDDHKGHDHDAEGHEHGEEHHHDFESLSQAVAEIETLRDTIRDHFAEGHSESAHDPLHHIGDVLIATENLLKSSPDSEQKTAAIAAISSLLDSFTAVDDSLHPGDENQGKSYDEVSKSIDDAIAALKKGAE